MIKINLLPEDLKPKPKKAGIDLESKEVLYLLPLIFGVLLVMHIVLGGALLFKNLQIDHGRAKLRETEKQIKAVENMHSDALELFAAAKALSRVSLKYAKWAPKLNKLSLNLPAGLWFRGITLSAGKLDIQASVVSLERSEMALISRFIGDLKKDKDFFTDFSKFDIGLVQKRFLGSYEVTDFSLLGVLKDK